ncbi:MAG TPA: TIM barrel protein [Rhizomicrobium sp.]|nr:TIM barrel protein [Rhizomicrobium sp.]
MEMMLADVRHFGLQGFEPYAAQIIPWLGRPEALKALAERAGVALMDVGDVPPAIGSPPTAGVPADYPWLGGKGRVALIERMEAFARDFLQPLDIDHWKNNMGARPPGGPSNDQLKALADTANEIGLRTKKYGVRLSLHPHLWGPMERERDFRTVVSLTDPNYVWLILDTGHNVLGGMDPVKIADEFFPRISEFHLKDTYPKFRNNSQSPTPAEHANKSVYASVGQGGGVDFPGLFRVMRQRRFKGWAVFDIDAPRPGDGTGSVDDNLEASVRYMRDVLHVQLPQPSGPGLFKEA